MKKLTITVEDDVYKALYAHIGRGKISNFINEIAKDLISNKHKISQRKNLIDAMRGKSTIGMTTDEIMKLTRDI